MAHSLPTTQSRAQQQEQQQQTFYRRQLPSHLISFTSKEGRRLFKETLNNGYAESYFNLAGNFTTQSEPAYCGPSSLAMVLNALEVDPGRTWKGAWRWYSDEILHPCGPEDRLKSKGITFDQFHCLASSHCSVVAKRGNEVSRDEFREDLRRVCQCSDTFMVMSFSRRVLGQTGDGHFSPVGAYHTGTDRVMVLDTARYKYPVWFGATDLLYDAMQPTDKETGKPRGYFMLRKQLELPRNQHQHQHQPECSTSVHLPECPSDVIPTPLICSCKQAGKTLRA
ncbi:hypothetical protein EV182_000241 [Spiromyces aspiralis]|uniref:Uncharacterized protein n=1 Tax=Spiromyces aspiralis TaxID=68401 RepID=A0ACC1HJK0_9FUNG|nr:hypothetical protein EV182_000241 [Spiromyces aspiralis]